MFVKVQGLYGEEDQKIVEPLSIAPAARSGDRLHIIFAGDRANESIDIDLPLVMLERAFNEAAKNGDAVVDLTPSGIETIKMRFDR